MNGVLDDNLSMFGPILHVIGQFAAQNGVSALGAALLRQRPVKRFKRRLCDMGRKTWLTGLGRMTQKRFVAT